MPPLLKEPASACLIELDKKDTVQRHDLAGGADDKPSAPPGNAHVVQQSQNLVRRLSVGQVACAVRPVATDCLAADEWLIERTFEIPGVVSE